MQDIEKKEGNQNVFQKNIFLSMGSIAIPDLIMADRKLSIHAKQMMGIILKFIQEKEEGKCFPTQTCLASMMQTSRRSISRYLDELQQRKYLSWERKGVPARNYYILKLPDEFNEEDFDCKNWSIDLDLFRKKI
jgi:DNA replication protein DnaD